MSAMRSVNRCQAWQRPGRAAAALWALWAATLLLTVVPLFAFATVFICAFASILTPLIGMTNANAESEVIASVLVNLGLFLIPAICIVVPATILFSLLISLTAPAVVLGGRNALAAIGQAFRLLFRYFGWVILTWLILTAIGIAVGAVVTVPAMALWLAVSRASIVGVWTPFDILLLAACAWVYGRRGHRPGRGPDRLQHDPVDGIVRCNGRARRVERTDNKCRLIGSIAALV